MASKKRTVTRENSEYPGRKIKRIHSVPEDEPSKQSTNIELSGIIQRIILKNIFCHEHLDFDGFTPSVNLLQGANGSGKSSIVAAIIAGLGGSSRATDRGASIKSLIQNGKNSASIEIYLKNKGLLAFKPDVYGNTVIVERKILMSGSSSYKIKSSDGHVVSTKKEDLNRILDWYNFQVDNPVLILSQERAKSFLSSTDPKILFEFYMTATQLRHWCDTYDMIVKDNQSSSTLVKHKLESLPILDKEVKQWEKKVQAINSLAKKREGLLELRRAKEWAEVKEGEQRVSELNAKLSQVEGGLEKLATEVKKVEALREELTNKSSASDGELVTLAERSKHWEAERLKWNEALLAVKRKLRERMSGKRELEKEAFERERDVAILREKLDKDHNDATTTWETTISQLNAEMETLNEKITKQEIGLQTEQVHMQNFIQSLEEAKEEYEHYSLQEKAIQRRLASLESEFSSVQDQKNNLSVFGQFMPKLVQEVGKVRYNFKNAPIGPIGAHIKVRDKKWAHIVETVTKGVLSSFLVSCREDYTALEQIFSKVIPKGVPMPNVIVSPFRNQVANTPCVPSGVLPSSSLRAFRGRDLAGVRVHNVDQYKVVHRQYFSMWSILETDDVQVSNALLDQLQVESILLVPTADEANDLLIEAKFVPRNCKKAMTLNGDTYFPDPNFRVYSGRGKTRVQFLQVSVEDKIKDLEMNIRSTMMEVNESRFETVEKKKRLETLQREKGNSITKQNMLNKRLNELKAQLQELKNREIPPPPDVYQLQNDLKENEALKQKVEEKAKALEEEIKSGKETAKEADENLRAAQKESENIKRTVNDHEVSTSQIQMQLIQKKKELLAYENRAKNIQEVKKTLLEELHTKDAQVKAKIKEIVAVYPERVESRKSRKELERDLLALQSAIEKEESNHGELEVITSTWRLKKQKYEKIRAEVKAQQSFVSKIKTSLVDRSTLLNATKKLLMVHLKTNFRSSISSRKLKGHVHVDYKAGTLKILMTKDTGSNADQLHSLQMMSGGERSFATVSFILALWDIVNSPLRIMDEFDIFMDVVSKKQCVEMILDSVKENIQYIMVSPLEYSIKSDKLHVFRMPNPDRRRIVEESEEV